MKSTHSFRVHPVHLPVKASAIVSFRGSRASRQTGAEAQSAGIRVLRYHELFHFMSLFNVCVGSYGKQYEGPAILMSCISFVQLSLAQVLESLEEFLRQRKEGKQKVAAFGPFGHAAGCD